MVVWQGGGTGVARWCLQWWKRLRRCGAGATFSNTRTRIICSYWSKGRGICNVMVEEGWCIKFFSVVYIRRHLRTSSFTYVVVFVRRNLFLASRDGDRGMWWRKITPPPPIFFWFLAAARSIYQLHRRRNLKNFGEFQFAITKYIRKWYSIIFPSYQ